jgi:DNA-binding transcriptional LysR family regulator
VVPVAFLHTFGTWLLPPLISSFRRTNPLVRFELRQHGEAAIQQNLLDGVVDLILTSEDPEHPQIRWRRLLVEPLRVAVPANHRLARRKRVRLADVAEEPFIVLRHGYGLRALTENLCQQAGFTPLVTFEGEEVETLRGLVAAGLGVALLPPPHAVMSTVDDMVPASHLEVTDVDAARDIGLAWLADRTLPSSSRAFHEHVLKAALLPDAYRRSS